MSMKYRTFLLTAALSLVVLYPHTSRAAVDIDGTATVGQLFSGATSVTITGKTTAGTNRLGVVHVGGQSFSGTSVTSCTWNGVAMTSAITSGDPYFASLWYIVNPPIGASNITCNMGLNYGYAFASSYTGVDQFSPIGHTGKSGGSGTPSLLLYSSVGNMVVDALGTYNQDDIVTGSNTLLATDKSGGTVGGAGSYIPGASSVTLSWASQPVWYQVAAELKEAGKLHGLARPPNNLGLMGYWPLDEGSGTVATDHSGNGNTGTLINSPTWTNGNRGKALSFNGSNTYVQTPTQSITGSITTSAWVYSSNFNQSGFIIGKNSVNTQWELFFQANDGLLWRGGAQEDSTLCSFPANNTWHHIVGTQSGTSGSLYIDGVLCDTGTPTAIGNGSGTIDIGRFNSGFYFNGKIDDVRLYNRALSAAEVANLYNSGAAKFKSSTVDLQKGSSLERDLVGHWTFDGPDVTDKIYDRSGQGNNGYFVGGATSTAKTIGKLGQGLKFDGVDDYVNINTSGTLSGAYTIGAWVKPLSFDGADAVFGSRTGSDNSFDMQIASNGLHGDIGSGGGWFTNSADASYTFVPGNWYHVLYVVTLTGYTIYVQGVPIASGSYSGTPLLYDATHILKIANAGNYSYYFNSVIDDARVYSRALSAAEVKQLYNLGQATVRSSSHGTYVVYLTSGSSWTVPSNWSSSNNTIEVIGGGGGGASFNVTDAGWGGGGGGAYSKATNVTLTPGASVIYAVGTGGGATVGGGDTYFCNSSSNCSSIGGSAVVVGAKGGSGSSSQTGGSGGASGGGVGSTKYSGGAGGAAGTYGGAGGGGAAGPSGAGANGGTGGFQGAGGGGGASGGSAGGDAPRPWRCARSWPRMPRRHHRERSPRAPAGARRG